MFPTKSLLFISSLSVLSAIVNSRNKMKVLDFQTQGELEFAHVIYRHGDRNPLQQSPGDKYDISYWPEGWGQLTNLGKQQHYELGQWLRRRYRNFLSTTFNVTEMYVQSSDVDRTLMSAQANLAGLYPPQEKNEIWNHFILWQPVPVHTKPVTQDYLIAGDVPTTCASYEEAYNEYLASDEMKKCRNAIQPLYDYLTEKTGTKFYDYYNVTLLHDSWFVESIHKLRLPEWSEPLYPNNEYFDKAAMKFFYLSSATKFLSKFSSGFLLKDMLDRFTSKVENTLSPELKLWMYSTHDSTLFNFLNSLDIFDHQFIPYAAAIILELRRYQQKYYVQIFYKNSEKTPHPIKIPGCGNACPLSRMYEIYDDILPKYDFATECEIDE